MRRSRPRATLRRSRRPSLVDAHVDARDVDVARFVATLPATRLTVAIDALPVAEGFAGTLSAHNADAGALDAGRVPLTRLTSRFDWNGRVLVLEDIDARLRRRRAGHRAAPRFPATAAPSRCNWPCAISTCVACIRR